MAFKSPSHHQCRYYRQSDTSSTSSYSSSLLKYCCSNCIQESDHNLLGFEENKEYSESGLKQTLFLKGYSLSPFINQLF